MVAGEISSGSGNQSRKLGQKLHGLEDEMRGAVLEGVFDFADDLTRSFRGQIRDHARGRERNADDADQHRSVIIRKSNDHQRGSTRALAACPPATLENAYPELRLDTPNLNLGPG